ncbi:MAG: YdcH family protein [Neomegalonema sp.]|nr:YdcH family protein [Neomegalonema sp.]
MSLESHVKVLQEKHRTLDKAISQVQRQPGASELEIKELKRQKLKLRDEIERSRLKAS